MKHPAVIAWSMCASLALGQSQFGDAMATGCPSSDATPVNIGPVSNSDYIELRRTICYGSCPVYTVRVGGDGSIHWHGELYVKKVGDAVSQVDPAKARALLQSAKAQRFWSLCGEYSRPITDNPTYTTTLSIAGRRKTVSDYARSAPEWVQELEMQIDSVADTYHWRKGDPAEQTFDNRDLYLPKPGVTPLMKAAASRRSSELLTLLQRGADANAEDASGWTSLMYASGSGGLENVKLLLAAGAHADHRSKFGETAIFAVVTAFWDQPVEKIRLLKAAGADINAQNKQGNSALMMAAHYFRVPEIIPLVLEAGADKRLKNNSGQTAADILDLQAKGVGEKQTEAYIKAHELLVPR